MAALALPLLELVVWFWVLLALEVMLELLELLLGAGLSSILGAFRKIFPVCKALRSTKYVKKFPFKSEFSVAFEL